MRWIARFFLIVALVFLFFDLRDENEQGQVILTDLGERWYQVDPDSYQLLSPAISRHVSAWLDDRIVQPLMVTPAFVVFFVPWLVISLLSWMAVRSRAGRDEDY